MATGTSGRSIMATGTSGHSTMVPAGTSGQALMAPEGTTHHSNLRKTFAVQVCKIILCIYVKIIPGNNVHLKPLQCLVGMPVILIKGQDQTNMTAYVCKYLSVHE